MNQNKRLYHYTSVDATLKILQTQKLRLNNLTAMDDPEEAKSEDSYNAGRWVFTSSWTTLRDNKKMFQAYGMSGEGVCISLPEYPFYTMFGNPLQKNKLFMQSIGVIEPVYFTRGTEIYTEKYNLMFLPAKVEQISVIYTDYEDLLYPKVSNKTSKGLSYFDGLLGKYKDLKWSYQKEIRYRLRPTLINNMHRPLNENDYEQMMSGVIYAKISENCPVDYIDIPINLRNIEIILGSRVDNVQKSKIQKVAKRYCPNPIFLNSNINW
ncbi:DUF2971 domain-containing protein [Lactobacillus kefiranofaciens]|uniref:DUF2971 domain-containing protein n=1 Tax=Lactobacillus kefiranofaciens TaxID=267818 RepID=UPI0016680B1D|nr:DUF2971 domain-containing protein [Lactobacillus kefiranofaciens]MCJ2172322.1 DUF2971 domain-containing protein [Lactobacillus kefiranofaciens]MCP9330908.1 DUF2971 domain-containing protein [Lactobacillus kefiranofaciens]QNT44217.1 DUF2971 domain-containing protein [Lactobacillus kefiranofaciens]